MNNENKLSPSVLDILQGRKVEAWLRTHILRSLLALRFMPNKDGEITRAVRNLDAEQQKQFVFQMINARSRCSAQKDFFGTIGIPIFIGFISVMMLFDVSVLAITLYFSIIIVYMIIYFYYRLMFGAIDSILESLRIEKDYF